MKGTVFSEFNKLIVLRTFTTGSDRFSAIVLNKSIQNPQIIISLVSLVQLKGEL
jgi:hypothetical protein